MSENEKNEQNEYAPLKLSTGLKSNQAHHVLNF